MFAIEFQTQIRNGVIEIPAEQREALLSQVNGGVVRVIVMAPEKKPSAAVQAATEPEIDLVQDAKDKGYSSFIDYLRDHPLQVDDPTPLTREEIYDRRNF